MAGPNTVTNLGYRFDMLPGYRVAVGPDKFCISTGFLSDEYFRLRVDRHRPVLLVFRDKDSASGFFRRVMAGNAPRFVPEPRPLSGTVLSVVPVPNRELHREHLVCVVTEQAEDKMARRDHAT